ncbi:MAG: SDR family NAD(P)-dependent oxidoreductase [Sandaracinaceae bacterium]|nr:SDR family NAD(P)-dependent oxidoreductase [Sandaracinaceae bacterium]
MGRKAALLLAEKGAVIAGFDVDDEGRALARRRARRDGREAPPRVPRYHRSQGHPAFPRRGARSVRARRHGGVERRSGLLRALRGDRSRRGAPLLRDQRHRRGRHLPGLRALDARAAAGKLVAVSSLVGRIPFPFESVYASTKFALEGMVLSFKHELAPFGIRVALIEPAQVSTGFAAKAQKLPDPTSPYRERARRFIDRDNDLIKSAPSPERAAEKYVEVITSENPKLFNQIDFMSTFFLALNQFLPRGDSRPDPRPPHGHRGLRWTSR